MEHNDTQTEEPVEDGPLEDEPNEYEPLEDVALEDLVSAFVDAFNTKDMVAIDELLSPDAEIDGIVEDADTVAGVIEEFQQRSPWTSLARAEVELDPVAAVWVPDEHERYRLVAWFGFEASGDHITRIEIFESVHEELLSEAPPASWAAAEVDTYDTDLASDVLSHRPVD